MAYACFGLNPWTVVILAVILTIVAIYFVLVSHQTDRMGSYLALTFIGITLFSLLFFKCWSLLIALLEVIFGLLMHRDKLKILRV